MRDKGEQCPFFLKMMMIEEEMGSHYSFWIHSDKKKVSFSVVLKLWSMTVRSNTPVQFNSVQSLSSVLLFVTP